MADPIVTDPGLTTIDVPTQMVYTRAAWEDEWDFRPHLHCDFAEHAAAPSMSSAQLSYEYGEMMRPGTPGFWEIANEFNIVSPLAIERYFIKVVFTPTTGPVTVDVTDDVTWYGIVLSEERLRHGSRKKMLFPVEGEDGVMTRIPSGTQIFHAVGMEWLFTRTPFTWTRMVSGHDNGPGGTYKKIGRALTFNGGNQGGGNTSEEDRGNKHTGGLYFAETTGDDNEEWTAWDTMQYLVQWATVNGGLWDAPIPLLVDATATGQGQWSLKAFKPRVRAHNRTLFDMLNELVDPRHAVGWHLEVDDSNMTIVVDSYAKNFIPMDGFSIWPNGNQKTLDFEDAGDISQCVTVTDTGRRFDRVVVRGARRGTIMTISYDEGTLFKGWSATEETAYEAGASGEGGYDNELELWITSNDQIRSHEALERVYTHHVFDSSWDGTTDGGTVAVPELDIDTGIATGKALYVYYNGMRFLPYLPLKKGWDYSSIPPTEKGGMHVYSTRNEFRRMFAVIEIPNGSGDYQYVDRLAAASKSETMGDGGVDWNCSVTSMRHQPGIVVNPSGLAHKIASADFTATYSSDTAAQLDYNDLKATVFFENDEHVEARWPAGDIVGVTMEQTLTIDVGDDARLDYIAHETTVGITDAGAEILSASGFIRDDRDRILALAKASYEWYKESRQALTLSYRQLSGLFSVGNYITQIGDGATLQDVNTVITSVRWDFGASPSTTVTTSFAELDLRT